MTPSRPQNFFAQCWCYSPKKIGFVSVSDSRSPFPYCSSSQMGYTYPLGCAKALQGVHELFNCLPNEILMWKYNNYREIPYYSPQYYGQGVVDSKLLLKEYITEKVESHCSIGHTYSQIFCTLAVLNAILLVNHFHCCWRRFFK